jgi:hypothetical protein
MHQQRTSISGKWTNTKQMNDNFILFYTKVFYNLILKNQPSVLISRLSFLNFSHCYWSRNAQSTEHNTLCGLQAYQYQILNLIWASYYIYIFSARKKELWTIYITNQCQYFLWCFLRTNKCNMTMRYSFHFLSFPEVW